MRKVGNRFIDDFPPATLYLDDVKKIIDAVLPECRRVTIRIGDYEFSEAGELEEVAKYFPNGQLGDISIQAEGPYLSINISKYGVSAYVSEDTAVQRGVVVRVRDIVDARKTREPRSWAYKAGGYGLMFLAAIGFGMEQYALATVAACLVACCMYLDFRLIFKPKVILYATIFSVQPSFFERRKDEISIALISAFVGALATVIVTNVLG